MTMQPTGSRSSQVDPEEMSEWSESFTQLLAAG